MFNVNPDICTYSLIYSYAKNAKEPILFSHYNHDFTAKPYTSSEFDNNWCSLFISLSGNFSFILNDRIYSPSFGDAVVMREHEKYSSCFHSVSRMDYYEFNFPVEFFEKAPVGKFSKLFYSRKISEKNMISLGKTACALLLDKLRALESTPSENDLLMYSYIIQILDILYTAFSYDISTLPCAKIPPKLKDAIIYIHSSFLTIYSVAEVAEACNVSTVYLARIFKKHLSCTPNDYINNLRISYSKHLLANGESLTDTCFKSGFNSYTYFISKFKSSVGVTPAKFKKEML